MRGRPHESFLNSCHIRRLTRSRRSLALMQIAPVSEAPWFHTFPAPRLVSAERLCTEDIVNMQGSHISPTALAVVVGEH